MPTDIYVKKRGDKTKAKLWNTIEEALNHLTIIKSVAGQIIPGKTAFTFAENDFDLDKFKLIAGKCSYIGREGIEFYPQELQLLKFKQKGPSSNTVFLENIQYRKSKYKIGHHTIVLEKDYLFPLVKGSAIKPFRHDYDKLIVAFPYKKDNPKVPIDFKTLQKQSPLLLQYYIKYKLTIEAQTDFSDKIRGPNPGEFYGLARTGPYSFAEHYVAFRDNTRWCAVVVTSTRMPWGDLRRFLFQNHAVSMCERITGGFINYDEAHYICAIFNAPMVEKYIYASSDFRSFKIRPDIYVPLFDINDDNHKQLSKLSKKAHNDPDNIIEIVKKIESIYLKICKQNHKVRNL